MKTLRPISNSDYLVVNWRACLINKKALFKGFKLEKTEACTAYLITQLVFNKNGVYSIGSQNLTKVILCCINI